jgi:hypothetical protein
MKGRKEGRKAGTKERWKEVGVHRCEMVPVAHLKAKVLVPLRVCVPPLVTWWGGGDGSDGGGGGDVVAGT